MIDECDPIHIIPENDKRKHLLSEHCPCEPALEMMDDTPIYTHRAYDHRQLFEDLEEWWHKKYDP